MTASYTDADFEALQNRVDSLCNILCDLATQSEEYEAITAHDIKRELKAAGVIE